MMVILVPFGVQASSLAIPSSSSTLSIPNRAPYTALRESRVEFRLHSFTWSAGKQIVSLGGARVFFSGPGYQYLATRLLCATNDTNDDMHDYGGTACVDINERTDIVVRIQRTVTQWPKGEWSLEVWDTAGGGYVTAACAIGKPCPIAEIKTVDFHGQKNLNSAPVASGAIAWLKWWKSTVPLNHATPKMTDSADLGSWIFNTSLIDRAQSGINLTVSNVSYVSTPAFPPVCGISDTVLNARGSNILQSTSYPLDGNTTLTYEWSVLSGSNTPALSRGTTPSPTLSNITYGAYVVQLTATDASGQSSTCTKPLLSIANYANTTVSDNHPPAGGILYTLDNISDPLQTRIKEFYGRRLNVAIGSNQNMATACASAGRYCLWPIYIDQSVYTPDAEYSLFPLASSIGLDMESIINHMKVDYSIAPMGGNGPSGNLDLGQFDLFENTSGAGARSGSSVKGAFLLAGSTYTDVTAKMYDGTAPQAITDTLLLGYALPFAQVNMILTVPRTGGTVGWQYWNGTAWASLALASDGTNGLTQNGQINFVPPANWSRKIENGSKSKYWIRLTVSGAGIAPVYKRVWGDEWVQTPTVFTLNGNTYTNVSFNIHHGFTNITLADKLLIGFATTQVQAIDWVVANAAVGATVSYQYWNGSAYTTLKAAGATALTASGMASWPLPTDWVKNTENGVNAYWVRVTSSGGTPAVISTVWSKSAARGWSYTDTNRVNQGMGSLEYNPTPPAGSTAKFRYQARLTAAIWLHNYFVFNPSDQQNGSSSVAQLQAKRIIDNATAAGATAVMLDDAVNCGGTIGPTATSVETHSDWSGSTPLATMIATLKQQKALVHAAMGREFTVAGNGGIQTYNWHLDAALTEAFKYSFNLGNFQYTLAPNPDSQDMSWSFDAYLPENNPERSKGWMMIFDTTWDGGHVRADDVWYPWDRGNRGPMTALAGYHMGSTEDTVFIYNARNAFYHETDQFYMRDPAGPTLTAPLAADPSTDVKTIAVTDSSRLSLGTSWVGNCGNQSNVALGNQLICVSAIPDGKHIQTTSPIRASYESGSKIAAVLEKHQAVDPIPPLSEVWGWGVSFPAMWQDIGVPDATGHNGGARDTAWKLGADITGLSDTCRGAGCTNVWRRDFTKSMILTRPYHHDFPANFANDPRELNVPSKPIDLGGTYYPLLADGNTGPAITSIQLRAAEGAILLKSPLQESNTVQALVGVYPQSYPGSQEIGLRLDSGTEHVESACESSPCPVMVNAPLAGHSLRTQYSTAGGKIVASSAEIQIR